MGKQTISPFQGMPKTETRNVIRENAEHGIAQLEFATGILRVSQQQWLDINVQGIRTTIGMQSVFESIARQPKAFPPIKGSGASHLLVKKGMFDAQNPEILGIGDHVRQHPTVQERSYTLVGLAMPFGRLVKR